MATRLISFANSAIAIEYNGPQLNQVIHFLYGHLPAGSSILPQLTYRCTRENGSGCFRVYRDNTLCYEMADPATLAEWLLNDSLYHLARASSGGLLLHAAGMAWQGQGLLLPGATGAGKSSLAAWLLTRGCDYQTDELVFVGLGSDTMQGFTRPLCLKHSARDILQKHFGLEEGAAGILSATHGILVSPIRLRPASVVSTPPLHLIIFPHYRPDDDFEWRPLSSAQAGLALMQCLINARNLPGYGFSEITRLARAVPAYVLGYSNFEQVDRWLDLTLY